MATPSILPAETAVRADPALDLHRPAMGAIMLAHAAVDIQTSALTVLLPPLLTAFSLNYGEAAAIISANNLIIAVAQPLFGVLGDYRPLRWLVLAGCVLCGLGMAAVLFLPAYWMVIGAVIVSGLGSAAFHPEALSATRAISGRRQATGSSLFFFAGNLGFAIGPLLAAWLIDGFGPRGALWMLVPVGVGVAAVMTQRRVVAQPAASALSGGISRAQSPARSRRATVALVGFLMVFISVRLVISGGLQTFIPLYFSAHSALTKPEIAQLLTVLAVAGTVGTLFSGPVAERLGRRRVIAVAMVAATAALAVFLRVTGPVQALMLAIAGAALSVPWTLSVTMVQDALPNRVGLASGLSLGTAYGAMGLGVGGLGALADVIGLEPTMGLVTLLPVAVLVLGLFVPERATDADLA